MLGLDAPKAWDTETAFAHLKSLGDCDSKRTAERRIRDLGVIGAPIEAADLRNERGDAPTRLLLEWELDEARSKRHLALFAQLHRMPTGRACLQATDARGAGATATARRWRRRARRRSRARWTSSSSTSPRC